MERLSKIAGHVTGADKKKEETVTVTDNRTGQTVTIPVKHNTIDAKKLAAIRFGEDKLPLRVYDPGYKNTAAATSRITYIDGERGILLYRGIPIEQLAERSTFLEVSYLLLYGELPTRKQSDYFSGRVMRHTYVHEELKNMMKSFRYNAHPMGMFISAVSAMSTFHPEANPALAGQGVYKDLRLRNKQIHRILGTMPTIAAFAYRHRIGRPYVDPSHKPMGYAENFLYMLDRLSNADYRPHPKLARAMETLFILHADHELNCSTSGMRHLASSGVDVYTCIAGSAAALYGPRHGGANEAVLRMLEKIGDVSRIPDFLQGVKDKRERLMGFGHRVYKSYDPRARIIRKVAEDVFSVLGKEPLIELAIELERQALADPYFVKRKLAPNVDFFSGLIYKCLGYPKDYFTVLFAIPRCAGWLAHWNEFTDDKENVIVRPRQVYLGKKNAKYVPIEERTGGASSAPAESIQSYSTAESRRRAASGTNP